MPDFQLFELMDIALDRAWSHLQWWGGISFGLIALTNFAAKKLNLIQVIVLAVLYTAFSWYSWLNLTLEVAVFGSFAQELEARALSGELSPGAVGALTAYTSTAPSAPLPLYVSTIGTYLATLAFLVSTYIKQRMRS
jgi:hypothetical protein